MPTQTETKRFQRCLEAAVDCFHDAMNANSLAEQLVALKATEQLLVEAQADPSFPFFYAWRKSDGTMCYDFDGPSTLEQIGSARHFVNSCFYNAVRHLYQANPRELKGKLFTSASAYEGPLRPQ